MPSVLEDQNDRAISPTIGTLDKMVAVLSTEVKFLREQVTSKTDTIERKLDDALARYATKEEVDRVIDEVKGIKSNISWGVKIVVGAVIVAILSFVVVKNGGVPLK